MQDFGEKRFSNATATLVGLLVLTKRQTDADHIAAAALQEWNDPQLKEELEQAKQGNVPLPWP